MRDAAAQAQQKQIEDAQNFEREKIQFKPKARRQQGKGHRCARRTTPSRAI